MEFKSLVNGDEGVWLPYLKGVEIQVRPIPPKEIKRLQKVCTTSKWKKGKLIETLDIDQFGLLSTQAAVQDWKGIDLDGKPLPCTPENIELLSNQVGSFNEFVMNALDDLDKKVLEKNQGQEKN